MSTLALVLLVVAVPALVVSVVLRWTNPVSDVADELRSPLPVAAVEALVVPLLTRSPKVDVDTPLPGTYTLAYRSTPLFAVFLAVFLFPIGLLALLFVHVDRSLTVSITEAGEGSRIQVFGRVHEKLARSFGSAVRLELDAAARRV